MQVGTVSKLWRHPVKSMAGETLERAHFSLRGIPGDRGWAVYDETREGITNGKRLPALRLCRARYLSEPAADGASPPVEITLPDGRRVRSGTPDAAEALSTLVGRKVSLRGLGTDGGESSPRVTLAGEPPDMVRRLNGLLPGEPMPDMSALPPERLKQLREGNFFDAFPLHVLSGTTLRSLVAVAPESDWDVRRFRCNVFFDAVRTDGHPEHDWVGRRLMIGDAVIEVAMGCPRCVMVTQAVGELPQDHRIMRTLVRETRHTAGIYARIAEEGRAGIGDPVVLLDEAGT